jgi:Membrane domain of glycerophosphoryl diester phosphodiesterase
MTPTLRPMNFGEILDRSFQIYRSRFFAFIGIAAAPVLTMHCLEAADNAWFHVHSLLHPFHQPGTLWKFLIALGFYHVSSVLSILAMPAHVKLVSGQILGERKSIFVAIRFAASRWRTYFWIAILKVSAQLIIPEVLASGLILVGVLILELGGALNGSGGGLAVLIVFAAGLCGLLLFLWIGACLALTVPAAALEQLKGMQALRRSWSLSKASRGRILLLWIVVILALTGAVLCIYLILRFLMFFIGKANYGLNDPRGIFHLLYVILSAVAGTLIAPIYPIAATLFYYDQRIRKEGFDIEQMMAAAGMIPTESAAQLIAAAPPPAASPSTEEFNA